MNKLRFGHYLELSGPGGETRAANLGLSTSYREEVLNDSGLRILGLRTSREHVVETLGVPDQEDAACVRYNLGVRPGYLFEFTWHEQQHVMASAYVREIAVSLDCGVPKTRSEANELRARFCRDGITSAELLTCFGEPQDRTGWWPYETWMYGGGLSLELRLGIVEG